MLLAALTNLIYKLLILICVLALVSTLVHYFILKIAYNNKEKSSNNFQGKNTNKDSVKSKNHCNNNENRVIKVIELDKKPKEIIIQDTKEIKDLKMKVSESISSNMKSGNLKRDDILKLSAFITKITSKKRSKRHKNDLHFIYSTVKCHNLSEKELLKILYFLKNRENVDKE